MIRPIWIGCGALALGLGAIGLFLPLLPTVPFLLVAAFCFGRSSARLHAWILAHPVFGPPIRDWSERGAIAYRAKVLASLSMAIALAMTVLLGFGPEILTVQAIGLVFVAIFIWTRPAR